MKKFLSGIVAGALVFGILGVYAGSEYFAKKADFKVFVNGTEFHGTTGEVLDVNDRTYLPLRDMGNALGVAVEWNEELRQVEVGTKPNNQTPSSGNYSRSNPAPLNTVQTVSVDNLLDKYTASVRVISAKRGSEAWKQIKAENMFNDEAPDGYEYILAKVAVSALSIDGDKSISISKYDFKGYSSNNESYDTPSVVVPGVMSASIYAGGNCEGNIVICVKKDDANPKVAFGLKYDGSGGVWFALQ